MRLRSRGFASAVALAAALALVLPGATVAIPPGSRTIGLICDNGSFSAGTRTFNLVANSGDVTTPDGNAVFMWSYANADAPDNGAFQSPGPFLCANQGETLVVHLHNSLPAATSIVFPGQDAQVTATGGSAGLLTTEAAPGGNVTYAFTAGSAGTYIYESGTNISLQIEMGLYGGLVIRPTAHADWAYGAARTQFDPSREYVLLFAEMDPDLHHAVETGDTYDFNAKVNRYFTINGRAFPDTIQDNGSVLFPTQPYGALVRIQPNTASATLPALIRELDVGADNHPFHPHGNHTREIAQDGRLLTSPSGGDASTEHFDETIGAGQTIDYLLRSDDSDNFSPTNPLPVSQPNYRNLTFKDASTWYSGSPYLGYKGTLPTGTNSLNVCGEWYFPFHSHALNEFANYDAGFGGMGTLLRVDPAGGCFTFPSATKLTTGTLNSGAYTAMGTDDTTYYRINSTTTGTRTTDWYAQFSGVAPGSANLAATYKGRNCGTGTGTCPATTARATTLSFWNWTTSAWTQVAGPTNIGTTDVTMTNAPIASAAAYIGTGSNKGVVRVRVLTTGTTTNFVTGANLMKLTYDAP